MKLSEVSEEIMALHCRTTPEDKMLPVYWAAAKEYVLGHTGLTEDAADEYAGLTVAALAITADLVENKNAHIDNDKVNKVIDSFMGLHDRNLLPGVAAE